MLDGLAALRQRTKAQIAAARRQTPSAQPRADRPTLEKTITDLHALHRSAVARELDLAESILPSAAAPPDAQAIDSQLVDPWARLVSEFKRQLDSSTDLRVMIADDALLDAVAADHPTVKFFKGVLAEWCLRLFALPNEELARRKPELTMMWYCLFALQPLFRGLNEETLSRDIAIEAAAIANELKKLNFETALDHYNLLAIGKGPWPLWTTEYSLYWKFWCDLIDCDRILHLFNSAPARNMAISIKRLMTKYEEFHRAPAGAKVY
jgi:pre-mRNA-splicing factor 18